MSNGRRSKSPFLVGGHAARGRSLRGARGGASMVALSLALFGASACGDDGGDPDSPDAGQPPVSDAQTPPSNPGTPEAGPSGSVDAAAPDGSGSRPDAADNDATGHPDAPASGDAGSLDGGAFDAGPTDVGASDVTFPPDGTGDARDAVAPPDGSGGGARPPCLTQASQVVLLGDSYVNWISHTFPADLAKQANGLVYRDYAIGGYSMASGGIGFIPPQFDKAAMEDPNIIAAVMTGGGNDILVADTTQFPRGADCKNSDTAASIPDCQQIIQKAADEGQKLLDRMGEAGVKDVVYFFYPHVPEPTLVGGSHPNVILDYALPKMRALCTDTEARTSGKIRCHFIDLAPVFENHPELFTAGDIHPNPLGSAQMAQVVWSTMKNACIAQPASSGCCAQ